MVDAFAAGALLVMLTDSMIPDSFEHGGTEAGLSLVFGFGVAAAMALS
jgi:ZIP family zinc transporter